MDFENVPRIDASVLGAKAAIFTLLLGAKQTKLDTDLVEQLMQHATSVQLIRLTSSGKNALDFALAYYVGRAVSSSPAAFIHIVSKDKGFDPLVEHLRSRHIHAHRHDSFATLNSSGAPKATPMPPKAETAAQEDPLGRVLEHLRTNVTNRPKKKATNGGRRKYHLERRPHHAPIAKASDVVHVGRPALVQAVPKIGFRTAFWCQCQPDHCRQKILLQIFWMVGAAPKLSAVAPNWFDEATGAN